MLRDKIHTSSVKTSPLRTIEWYVMDYLAFWPSYIAGASIKKLIHFSFNRILSNCIACSGLNCKAQAASAAPLLLPHITIKDYLRLDVDDDNHELVLCSAQSKPHPKNENEKTSKKYLQV